VADFDILRIQSSAANKLFSVKW